MRLVTIVLASCLLNGGLCVGKILAQETPDYLLDLAGLRDPFASQLPIPVKVDPPRAIQTAPVGSDVEIGPSKSMKPVQDPTAIAGNATASNQMSAQAAVGSLVVNGIVWNTNSPQAIINNQILKVGDEVQGMQILSIERAGIELSTKSVDQNGVTQNGVNVKIGMSDNRK